MRCLQPSLFLCLFMRGLFIAGTSLGDEKFAAEVRVEAAGAPIDVAGFRGAAPFVGDFDGDGLNDLLVGQDEMGLDGQDELGRLRIYRNVGSRKEPRFEDFEWFLVNGKVAEIPGEGRFRPQLADLDGDGKLDMVTSLWSGIILWYRRLAGGEFANAEIVRLANGQVLNAGTDARCHVVDWDGDGDNDLIILGQPKPDARSAEVCFVENRGPPPALALAQPIPLEVDGKPIEVPQTACPFVADWNRDGKLDLLLGMQDGSIRLYENSGDKRAPRLAPARMLVEPAPRRRGAPDADVQRSGTGGSFCLTDWDNDGTLDVLMGDAQSVTVQPDPSETQDQLQEARREAAEVLSQYRRLRGMKNRLRETQETQREFVQQKREQFARRLAEIHDTIAKLETAAKPRQELHGYVWLLKGMNPE